MSGFSSPEFLLIVVLALVVLGPKRLPEIANKVGSWVGQARRLTRVMRRQLEEELDVDNLNQIASPKLTPTPAQAKAASEAEAELAAESGGDDKPEEDGEDIPDHIPHDDDTFSPLHAEDEKEKPA